MSRKMIFGTVVCVLIVVLAAGVPAAATTSAPLYLPQPAAFSVLGRSCGGIQEKSYATGFDTTSGYPTGDVYLSTRCGGSGRGGGYHTTTYSTWVAVTWDFTTAVVSYARVAAPAVDAGFSAFDAYGNQVYNQFGSAYLALATGFIAAPRITSVSPTSGPATGGTPVAIVGTGFTGATGVSFGETAAASFTVNSSTSITAHSPAAGAGSVDVTVTNGGGASGPAADRFTFVAAPSVSSLDPSAGPVDGGTEVTISGEHLTDATQVTFGGTPAGFWVNDDTSITAIAPAAESAESVHVRVTTVGGRSAASAADQFAYTVSIPDVLAPTVASIDPSTGPGDGGTWVTITGTGFMDAVEVDFGGVPAGFLINDDTSITAISPPGTGTVDVTVTTLGGTTAPTAGDRFTYG